MPKKKDKKTKAAENDIPGLVGMDAMFEYGSEMNPVDVAKESESKAKPKARC